MNRSTGPALHFSLSVMTRLQDVCHRNIVVVDVCTIQGNGVHQRYCTVKSTLLRGIDFLQCLNHWSTKLYDIHANVLAYGKFTINKKHYLKIHH